MCAMPRLLEFHNGEPLNWERDLSFAWEAIFIPKSSSD